MAILVAGGAGFIGSHVTRELVRRGSAVLIVDNLTSSTGSNLAELEGAVEFIRGDAAVVEPRRPIEAVFHFASLPDPLHYSRQPIKTLLAGSEVTRHLLEIARQSDAQFLLASTSEVYGEWMGHPQKESDVPASDPTGPRSMYVESKRFAEALTSAFAATYGLSTRIIRIFNTYGPSMANGDGRVIPSFMHRAAVGQELVIDGDGLQTRSFCHVDDLVGGLLMALDRGDGTPLNLGNPEETSILSLAHTIRDLFGRRVPIVHGPARPADPSRRVPDIAKAVQLGWTPKVGLRAGLEGLAAKAQNHAVMA